MTNYIDALLGMAQSPFFWMAVLGLLVALSPLGKRL